MVTAGLWLFPWKDYYKEHEYSEGIEGVADAEFGPISGELFLLALEMKEYVDSWSGRKTYWPLTKTIFGEGKWTPKSKLDGGEPDRRTYSIQICGPVQCALLNGGVEPSDEVLHLSRYNRPKMWSVPGGSFSGGDFFLLLTTCYSLQFPTAVCNRQAGFTSLFSATTYTDLVAAPRSLLVVVPWSPPVATPTTHP